MRLADKIREQLQEDEKKMQVPFTETEKQFWTTEIMDFFLNHPTHNFVITPLQMDRGEMYGGKKYGEDNYMYHIAKQRVDEFKKWAESEGFVVKQQPETMLPALIVKLPQE